MDLPETRVMIHAIRIERYAFPDLELEILCGPGTYVRALARDLGRALGTGAYCAALRRERAGPFHVRDALTWVALAEPEAAREALLPAETVIADLPGVELDEAQSVAVLHGRALPMPDGVHGAGGAWVRLRGPEGFIGVAEIRENRWLQPRRILYPERAKTGCGAGEIARGTEW